MNFSGSFFSVALKRAIASKQQLKYTNGEFASLQGKMKGGVCNEENDRHHDDRSSCVGFCIGRLQERRSS